jgi:hypothetical protein
VLFSIVQAIITFAEVESLSFGPFHIGFIAVEYEGGVLGIVRVGIEVLGKRILWQQERILVQPA